ncbi:MAG: hypothetical protein QF864_04895 [SAR202 cluster bacterium]|nr:hypothetical protein [SAR202 cluster bacterium]
MNTILDYEQKIFDYLTSIPFPYNIIGWLIGISYRLIFFLSIVVICFRIVIFMYKTIPRKHIRKIRDMLDHFLEKWDNLKKKFSDYGNTILDYEQKIFDYLTSIPFPYNIIGWLIGISYRLIFFLSIVVICFSVVIFIFMTIPKIGNFLDYFLDYLWTLPYPLNIFFSTVFKVIIVLVSLMVSIRLVAEWSRRDIFGRPIWEEPNRPSYYSPIEKNKDINVNMSKTDLIESLRGRTFRHYGESYIIKQISSSYRGQNYLFGKTNYNFPLWIVGEGNKRIVSLKKLKKWELEELFQGNYESIKHHLF